MSKSAYVYGWNLSNITYYSLKDKHKNFEKEVKNAIAALDCNKFLFNETVNDFNNCSLGVNLGELNSRNFFLSDFAPKPSGEDKALLKDMLSKLDDSLVSFFNNLGEPMVFIVWGE